MRIVAKPGGTKQQFRAVLFAWPFDKAWTVPAAQQVADGWTLDESREAYIVDGTPMVFDLDPTT